MQKSFPRYIALGISVICCHVNAADNQKPMRLDFVNQQASTQKLDDLRSISTPEFIKTQADYFRKMHQALIKSGFTKDEALKIVTAIASSHK